MLILLNYYAASGQLHTKTEYSALFFPSENALKGLYCIELVLNKNTHIILFLNKHV